MDVSIPWGPQLLTFRRPFGLLKQHHCLSTSVFVGRVGFEPTNSEEGRLLCMSDSNWLFMVSINSPEWVYTKFDFQFSLYYSLLPLTTRPPSRFCSPIWTRTIITGSVDLHSNPLNYRTVSDRVFQSFWIRGKVQYIVFCKVWEPYFEKFTVLFDIAKVELVFKIFFNVLSRFTFCLFLFFFCGTPPNRTTTSGFSVRRAHLLHQSPKCTFLFCREGGIRTHDHGYPKA